MLVKIIVTILCIWFLAGLVKRYHNKQIRLTSLLAWGALWIGITLAAYWPGSTSFVANIFGVGRGMDLVVFLSILAIFYGLYRVYIKVEKVERKITQLVREDALRRAESESEAK